MRRSASHDVEQREPSRKGAPLAGGPVVLLATGEASPWGIALDGTYAYYTTSTAVRRVPEAGNGAAADVATHGRRR